MAPESESDLRLEIGQVLFLDLVGYSKLLIEEQKERLGQLTEIVLATAQVREAPDEQLIRLPTGDGMALVFQNSSEEPARCALEAAKALKAHPEIAVRMGIHSGPVSRMVDVSGKANVAGAGINMAQRVMDCGDAGHSLVSRRAPELDDSLAEAHTALAMLHYAVDYDWGHRSGDSSAPSDSIRIAPQRTGNMDGCWSMSDASMKPSGKCSEPSSWIRSRR